MHINLSRARRNNTKVQTTGRTRRVARIISRYNRVSSNLHQVLLLNNLVVNLTLFK